MVELDDFKPTFTPAVAAEFIGMVLLQFLSAASAANAADNGLAAAALGTGFAVTMLIQFVSYFFEAVADARDEPGHQDHDGVSQ